MKIRLLKISEAFVFEVAQATNATPGWIFATDPYFSERAILSSTRNNEIFNVLWKILNILKGLKKGNCTPSLETTAGSLSDVTEEKLVGPGPSGHHICVQLPLRVSNVTLGD